MTIITVNIYYLDKNTMQWLEPGPLNAEANTPTMRPPLHNKTTPK